MAVTNINSVTVTGNLVRDSELRDAGSSKVLNFSVAVNESVKKGDSWESYPNYIDVTLFGKRGESLAQYLKKGQKVGVQGKIHQDRWEKDGQKFSRIIVRAEEVELLGSKGSGESGNSAPTSSDGFGESNIPF